MSLEGTEGRRWLLVSDIDDTLTGDRKAMADLGQALKRRAGDLWFAVNSSRPSASVARTIAEVFPPELAPDARITAMGTEIEIGGEMLGDWQARFRDWPRDEIFGVLYGLGHQPHRVEFQTSLKVSFAVERAAQEAAIAALASLPRQIIRSGLSDFDVIPPGAGKDKAALFLAETLGNAPDDLIVAGDSGNDLAMFAIAPRAIAVGNARPELLGSMPATAYHSPARHAAGVLDGLIHFGVLDASP